MADKGYTKLKLLYIKDYLEKNSDEDHPVSVEILTDMLQEKGMRVGNVDATIIAQKPKMSPFIPQMKERLAAVMNIAADRINVKATTEEGLGFTGTGEGISSQAICLLM